MKNIFDKPQRCESTYQALETALGGAIPSTLSSSQILGLIQQHFQIDIDPQIVPSLTPSSANASAAGATLTVANMLTYVLLRSGAAGVTDTTPTAAAIVAGIPGATVGMGWRWTIRNANTGTLTLAAGSGVTLGSGNTNTTPTVNGHDFFVSLTNVTVGSEAVTIYSLDAPGGY